MKSVTILIINQQEQREPHTDDATQADLGMQSLAVVQCFRHAQQKSTPSSPKVSTMTEFGWAAERRADPRSREEEGFMAPRLSLAANNNIIMEAVKRPRSAAGVTSSEYAYTRWKLPGGIPLMWSPHFPGAAESSSISCGHKGGPIAKSARIPEIYAPYH